MKRRFIVLLLMLILIVFASVSSSAQQVSISGTTCPGAGCATFPTNGNGAIGIQITGTFVGTITFYGTVNGTTTSATSTYNALLFTPTDRSTDVSSTTGTGVWTTTVSGLSNVRVAFTSYTSGTAVVSYILSVARGMVLPPGSLTAGGSCTNQVVTAIAASTAVPTCATVTAAKVDNTIAQTGTDINTSNQVTATHLASALPVAQGGWGLATLTAHALYVGNGTSAPNAVAVCGTGTYVRGAAGADPGCSTLVLPNAATQGDLMVATSSNTEGAIAAVAAGSLLRSAGTSTVPAYTTATFPNTTAAGNYLISTTTNAVIAVTPAWNTAKPANQTGNATATLKMNGLGAAGAPCTITPVATGRVHFVITGSLTQTTTADGVTWLAAYGTGTAPANAAAASGTTTQSAQGTWTALTGMLNVPVTVDWFATGLALSTAVWFDLQIADVTGGTASITGVTCSAYEG